MKLMPVTTALLDILKDALMDSYNFIQECEDELLQKTPGTSVYNILLEGTECRKQNIAIIKDLIERYKN